MNRYIYFLYKYVYMHVHRIRYPIIITAGSKCFQMNWSLLSPPSSLSSVDASFFFSFLAIFSLKMRRKVEAIRLPTVPLKTIIQRDLLLQRNTRTHNHKLPICILIFSSSKNPDILKALAKLATGNNNSVAP